MSSHNSSFLSGTIFGIVIGLIFGHFTLWNRAEQSTGKIEELEVSQEFLPSAMAYELGPPSAYVFAPEERSGVVGEIRSELNESPLNDIEGQIHEERTSPLANAIAIRTVEHGTNVFGDEPDSNHALVPIEEPQKLDVGGATPVAPPQKLSDNLDLIREVIDREIPDVPQNQRDIWFESLKEMSVDDVTGVLRMWKAIGGPIPGLGEDALFDSTSEEPMPEPIQDSDGNGGRTEKIDLLLNQAIEVHRQNSLMSSTLGYLRIVPRFLEDNQQGKIHFSEVVPEIDFSAGQSLYTGNPLDLRIEGPGMFLVQDAAGNSYLTRRGRFSIDAKNQISLIDRDAEYVLQPVITVPESAGTVLISGDGQVSIEPNVDPVGKIQICPVLRPNSLQYYKNGLFAIAEKSPRPVPIPPSNSGCGRLQQGAVEVSNVLPAKEIEQVQRFRSERELW